MILFGVQRRGVWGRRREPTGKMCPGTLLAGNLSTPGAASAPFLITEGGRCPAVCSLSFLGPKASSNPLRMREGSGALVQSVKGTWQEDGCSVAAGSLSVLRLQRVASGLQAQRATWTSCVRTHMVQPILSCRNLNAQVPDALFV